MPAKRTKALQCGGWSRERAMGMVPAGRHPKTLAQLYVCPQCGKAVPMVEDGRSREHKRGTRAQELLAEHVYSEALARQRAGHG